MLPKQYFGHPTQVYGVEEYTLKGGKGDGMRFFHIRNGLGMELMVSADRCSDISRLTLDGKNMNYTSTCGQVSPQYFNPAQDGFGLLKSFNCGFLTTCGFDNIGVPNTDNGEFLGLHGKLSNLPADHIYYVETESALEIHATMRSQVIFGRKLTLDRVISCSLEENTFTITDRVTNEGSTEEPCMLLYHMNMGYPLLSETAELHINSNEVIPRDDRAAEDLDTWNKILTPTPNFVEQCYYHRFPGETGKLSLFNESINKGLQISFPTKDFPLITQWKMMGERDYVLGLEPCTNTLEGRSGIREKGELEMLAPGASKTFHVKVTLFNDKADWEKEL